PTLQKSYSVDQSQAGSHRLLRIVLVRIGITEIDEDTIAHPASDKAAEPGHDFSDSLLVCSDNFMEIFDIEMHRERRRADEIADHHRELGTFSKRRARRQAWSKFGTCRNSARRMEACAAQGTKIRASRRAVAARRTIEYQRRAALTTELCALRCFRTT